MLWSQDHAAAEVNLMILAGLIGILALFSLLSIVVGVDDPRQQAMDSRHSVLWRLGLR